MIKKSSITEEIAFLMYMKLYGTLSPRFIERKIKVQQLELFFI